MMPESTGWWPQLLCAAAGFTVLLLTWLGWRSGIARQLVSLAGIVGAIFLGFAGRTLVIPLLPPLGLPAAQEAFIAAAGLALVIYCVVVILSILLLKRTAHQSVGLVRVGYGFFGALIGLAKGLFLVWAGCIILRLLGTLGEVELALERPASQVRGRLPQRGPAEDKRARAFAEIKRVLDTGRTGALLDRVDPFASSFRRALPKLARVLRD